MESGFSGDFLTRWLPYRESFGPFGPWLVLGGGVLLTLVFVAFLGRMFRRKPDAAPRQEPLEDLAAYPPAPPAVGAARVHVENLPARVRLIVVAPVGRQIDVQEAALGPFLNQLIRGLGDTLDSDRPRIRIWPSPLSVRGFPPTFFRGIVRPEPEGQPSRWVLLAGTTKIGSAQMLLGLALFADQPNTLGILTLDPNDWRNVLRVGPV